ncbi:MAG: hypothetical protein FWG08_02495 [Propionibacteriaceae bacterium]|nr:hypothetical protein [Propionibacteriaceae bacterium]
MTVAPFLQELTDTGAYLVDTGGVEVGCGFVEEEEVGTHGECAGQHQALLLATGEMIAGVTQGQGESH